MKLRYKMLIIISIVIIISTSILIYNDITKNIVIQTVTTASEVEWKGLRVPIIMYHSVLRSKSGKYIVSPTEFENDLKYIQEKGYTTITMTDLIEYVYNDVWLPEKPIIITFDDGYYNNYIYAVPLLEQYNMKAVISIVGEYTDRFNEKNEVSANYGHLRWVDINMIIPEGVVEFQNHSYDLHSNTGGRKGTMKKRNESLEEYKKVLTEDIMKLQKEFQDNSYYTPNTFTYPFGAISKDSIEIIKELGFKASLSAVAGMNYITKDKDSLYLLKRYNRKGGVSTEKFFKNILE